MRISYLDWTALIILNKTLLYACNILDIIAWLLAYTQNILEYCFLVLLLFKLRASSSGRNPKKSCSFSAVPPERESIEVIFLSAHRPTPNSTEQSTSTRVPIFLEIFLLRGYRRLKGVYVCLF